MDEKDAVSWVKRWWWALAGGLTGGFGLLVGFLARGKRDAAPITLPEGPSPAATKAEKKVEEGTQAAEVQREQAQVAAETAHDTDVGALVVDQEKKAPELVESPEDLNDFLLKTGKTVREP